MHVQVELREIGVVRAECPIGQVPDALPMLEELSDRLLHVHSHVTWYEVIFCWGGTGRSVRGTSLLSRNYLLVGICCKSIPVQHLGRSPCAVYDFSSGLSRPPTIQMWPLFSPARAKWRTPPAAPLRHAACSASSSATSSRWSRSSSRTTRCASRM